MRLSSQKLLSNVIRASPLTLTNEIPSLTEKYSAATVACVLRIVPGVPGSHNVSGTHERQHTELQYPSEVLDLVHQKDSRVEFLLMKRAVRNKDAWSGDTAFPGGFLELGESDLGAIKRETVEEIGLDLGDTKMFQWLGRLKFTNFKDNNKVLVPHLFLYLGTDTATTTTTTTTTTITTSNCSPLPGFSGESDMGVGVGGPAMTLQPREVSEVRWIDVEELLAYSSENCGAHSADLIDIFWPPPKKTSKDGKVRRDRGTLGRELCRKIAKTFGCGIVHFPCFEFPISRSNTHAASSTAAGPDAGLVNTADRTEDMDRYRLHQNQPWVMWGMTFNIVRSLLQVGNMGQPYTTPETPFYVDNRLFNMYLRMWHRHLPYSGSHSASGKPLLTLSFLCTLGTYVVPLTVIIDLCTL